MAGGVLLPAGIKRDAIRAEGERLDYTGDDLDEFVDIVKALDLHYVAIARKKAMADLAASIKASQKKR